MAQFGRALRSGRRGRKFESCRLDVLCSIHHGFWPHGQAVKTTPSHGVNPGSIPGEVIRCFGTLCPKHLICQKKNGGQKEIFNFLCIQPYFLMIASVAQLVAQRIRNAWVAGSSPAGSFENKRIFLVSTFFCTQRDQYLLYSALLFQ